MSISCQVFHAKMLSILSAQRTGLLLLFTFHQIKIQKMHCRNCKMSSKFIQTVFLMQLVILITKTSELFSLFSPVCPHLHQVKKNTLDHLCKKNSGSYKALPCSHFGRLDNISWFCCLFTPSR